MITAIYRISDGSQAKTKIGHADKFYCLNNFINVFKDHRLILIADNCKEETLDKLRMFSNEVYVTSLGNAKSWRYAAEIALNNLIDDDIVYFVEDDYLHLPGSPEYIVEGLEIADYVTLYDHPDKYLNFSEGSENRFISKNGEDTIVKLTVSSHWKYTNSTTMTFATKVKTIREDKDVWWHYTEKWPLDFMIFWELGGYLKKEASIFKKSTWPHLFKTCKYRKLASPIPGRATHIELKWLSPFTEWDLVS